MSLALLLVLQASSPAAPRDAPLAIDFDLARVRPADPCKEPAGSEIVVCGRRPSGGGYPMAEMERRYRNKPIVAETGIGGGATARAYVEQVEIAPGMVSKRAMVGIRIPF
jgi:hypothetical protein